MPDKRAIPRYSGLNRTASDRVRDSFSAYGPQPFPQNGCQRPDHPVLGRNWKQAGFTFDLAVLASFGMQTSPERGSGNFFPCGPETTAGYLLPTLLINGY